MSVIHDNLARVRERIATAAERAGRQAADITLVGVTKYVDARLAAELAEAGCLDLGESRPQQLWEKAADASFAGLDVHWHMVGHLQRNKVARTVPLTAAIHSVDSLRLLKAVDAAANGQGTRPRVFLEVNCSGDPQKHGFAGEDLRQHAAQLDEYQFVDICGLMTMAAGNRDPATARQNFADLRTFCDELQSLVPDGIRLKELSMGMSGDFELAIAEGATVVRIGSALWEGVR